MQLTRKIIKVGNSAGVILPRELVGGKALVEIVEEPLDLDKDILEILRAFLADIVGIYLAGSYARGEQKEYSDVDVLAISNNTNKRIVQGKYNIIIITEKELEGDIENNALPLLPMLLEAKPIINSVLLEKYKKSKLTKRSLSAQKDLIFSSLKLVNSAMKFEGEFEENFSDAIAYSLVLNLRSLYIIECLSKGRDWSNKEFIKIIKKISGSVEAYNGYLRIKTKKKTENNLVKEEAYKISAYIERKMKELLNG